MGKQELKSELLEWLSSLEDMDTLQYLKMIMESGIEENDWWDDLTNSQKQGIERGLNDVKLGRLTSHEEVKKKYGI
jgi:predicted transcriptional regulator